MLPKDMSVKQNQENAKKKTFYCLLGKTSSSRRHQEKADKLRKNVSNNRKEWLDACQEARMAIN